MNVLFLEISIFSTSNDLFAICVPVNEKWEWVWESAHFWMTSESLNTHLNVNHKVFGRSLVKIPYSFKMFHFYSVLVKIAFETNYCNLSMLPEKRLFKSSNSNCEWFTWMYVPWRQSIVSLIHTSLSNDKPNKKTYWAWFFPIQIQFDQNQFLIVHCICSGFFCSHSN